MRVASVVLAAVVVALSAAHAQTVDKAKLAAQSKAAAAVDSNKSKAEGVATQRLTPTDMKKNTDDCHHKGSASDA